MRLMEGVRAGALVWVCLYCDAEADSSPLALAAYCDCRSDASGGLGGSHVHGAQPRASRAA